MSVANCIKCGALTACTCAKDAGILELCFPQVVNEFIDSIGLECGEELKEKIKNNPSVRMTAMQEIIFLLTDRMTDKDTIPHKVVSLSIHHDIELLREEEEK